MKHLKTMVCAAVLAAFGVAHAAVITIPQSALVPSTTLYTTDLGISIGSALVMTGGGNSPNIGGTRNDDGFSGPINFGFNLTFFGNTYSNFFANNNGNISFGAGISAFTATGLQGATQPLISAYFADVDTRNTASGVMSMTSRTTAAGTEVIITWPTVGYFSGQGSPLNTFQLVVRGDDYVVPAGQGKIGFFWTDMGWEAGSASGGGAGGLCPGVGGIGLSCTPAAVGFGDGQSNGYVLEGSTLNGIAGVVRNHRLWMNLDSVGTPVVPTTPPTPPNPGGGGTVPEPGTLGLVALGLLAARRFARR